MRLEADFWCDKRVLVTGHTGFKGGWLALWLQQLGANVTGLALPPTTTPNLFELARVAEGIGSHFCDIRDAERLAALVRPADQRLSCTWLQGLWCGPVTVIRWAHSPATSWALPMCWILCVAWILCVWL